MSSHNASWLIFPAPTRERGCMTSQRNYEASDYIGTSAAARAGVTKRPTSEILCTFSYTQSDRVARRDLSSLAPKYRKTRDP